MQNAINTNLSKITSKTSDLETLVKKLGTPEDSELLRNRYLQLQNETKALIQETNRTLEQLQSTTAKTEDERRQKETLRQNLSKQYMASIKRFQEVQTIGVQKEKESLARARSSSYGRQSFHESHGMDNAAYTNNEMQKQVVLPMEQDVDTNALRERDEQLRQLETNIVEVNELFKDIHKIVHEHGEIIDNIESNIGDTEVHVDTGNRQIKQAVTYQSAARRKKFILIAIAITVVVILVLILALYFGINSKK